MARLSRTRQNFVTDARKINDKAFKHECRDAEQYRDERLSDERTRLERRLEWAFKRGDAAGVKRLQVRLKQLEDDELADIDAGRPWGRFEVF